MALGTAMAKLNETLSSETNNLDGLTDQVFFTATRKSSFSSRFWSILTYDELTTSSGGSNMDIASGTFKVDTSGTYLFHAHVTHNSGGYVNLDIRRNGHAISSGDDADGTASVTVVVN